MPAKMQDGNLLVDVQIGDRHAWMKIGTHSPYSVVSRQMAEQLKLPVRDRRGQRVYDEAYEELTHVVQLPTLALGAAQLTGFTFLIQGESSKQPLPWDGVIGIDILSNYDVEIDAAHGLVNLFTPNQCGGRAAYWTQDFQTVPFELHNSEMGFQVLLENKPVRATLNTSATETTLNPDAAVDLFGLDDDTKASKDGETITVTGFAIPFHRHRFGNLEIGGVGFRNTEIGIISHEMRSSLAFEGIRGLDAIIRYGMVKQLTIGMHHLAKLRLLIAFGEGLIYVSGAEAH
jgi:hypothetical protein